MLKRSSVEKIRGPHAHVQASHHIDVLLKGIVRLFSGWAIEQLGDIFHGDRISIGVFDPLGEGVAFFLFVNREELVHLGAILEVGFGGHLTEHHFVRTLLWYDIPKHSILVLGGKDLGFQAVHFISKYYNFNQKK